MLIKKHLSPTKVLVEKTFSQEEVKKMEEESLNEKGRNLEIPGFRKGNAPLWKIRELVSSEEWDQLLSIKLQDKVIHDWIEENQGDLGRITRIVDFKSINKNDGQKSLDVEIEIEYFPRLKKEEVEKLDQGVIIKKETLGKDISASPKEIEEGLKSLQKKRTILKPAGGKLEKDRLAFIKISKEEDTSKEHQDIFTWGLEQYGKEFDEKTKQIGEGEEKIIEITNLTDENAKRLADSLAKIDCTIEKDKAKFKLKCEKIFVSETPELNDEFAKSLGKFETIKELESSMKDGIVLEKLYAEKDRRREALIEELIGKVNLEIPESLVEESAQREKEYFERNMEETYGEKAKELIEKRDKKETEEMDKSFKERARKIIKLHRIIEAIALDKKIAPTQEEIEEELKKIVASYPSPKEAEESLGDDTEGLKIRVAAALTYNKVLENIEKENKIVEDLEEEIRKIEGK